MKRIFYIIIATLFSTITTFAQEAQWPSTDDVFGVGEDRLRSWSITIDDIPQMIAWVINTIIAMAWVISIFALIFFAFKMQIASGITGDSSKVDSARKWMIAAIIGFIISISAWFIMWKIVDILIAISK